jgi:hypothetical protein
MQYFSKSFTVSHILSNIKLPAKIQVFTKGRVFAKVMMVMSKCKVKGKVKGGAMITTNWMKVVEENKMKVEDIFVFWFILSRDGRRLNLLTDRV